MPQQEWRVTLSNGDIVTVRSDKEPTMAEVMNAMRRSDDPKAPAATSAAPAPPRELGTAMMGEALGTIGDVATGALKGAGDTVKTLADAGRKYLPGFAKLDKAGSVQIGETLEPTNAAQSFGKGAERVGEFFVPGMAAERLVPLARGATSAVRLGGRMLAEGALAAPVAAAHGENPAVAAGVSAAMPAVGKAVEGIGRGFITRALKPTKQQLREMTGGAREVAEKTGRIVDTAIESRILGEGGAASRIGTRMDEINDIFAGPAGDAPSNVHLRLPQAVDDLRTGYRGGITSAGKAEPGVALPRGGVAAANEVMPEILEGVLGKPHPPPVNLPAGMQASWPMRALRDDVTAREAYAVAKRQNLENAKIPFGEHGSPASEAKKTVEVALRNAAKDAVPETKPIFGEVTKLVDVRKAIQNAPADMPRTAAGELVAGTSLTANLTMRLMRALGLPAGQATHIAGEALQNETLMKALITAGIAGTTEDR